MKIAEIAPPWLAVPPFGYGGIEWVVAALADGLVEHGHEVTLFATGDSQTKATLEYAFPEAPGPRHINSLWHDAVHSIRAFRNPGRFDILHVHTPWSALAAGVASGVPVVHTLHGSFTPEMRRLYAEVAESVWFVPISGAQRRQMSGLRYTDVVYNGIDLELYPFSAKKDDYVLFVGRVAPEKGLRNAMLAAQEAGLRLVCALKIVSESERREWRMNVAPILSSEVEVHRDISHEEKVRLMEGARALLFPIDWEEPFGMVMTEAMACGTPVIATPRGSVPEVVADGETGFVVPVEGYSRAAAEQLRRIDEIDPDACRARVRERFSKEAMVTAYERVFEQVLAEG